MVSILGANSVSGGYEISNSLRLNDGDSPSLSFTPTHSSDNVTGTYTFSAWIKRSVIGGSYMYLFSHTASSNDDGYGLAFHTSDNTLYVYRGAGIDATAAQFRDPAAWYHIVLSVNSTSYTLYVNGTSIKTGTAQSLVYGKPFNVGNYNYSSGSNYFDGYMADVHFIDGTAKAATDFGETNSNGVWIPKEYTGSYGTNGFFLEFKQTGTSQNSSGIGADTSGQDNHLAVSNLVASSVVPDTPTLNYATMNPLDAAVFSTAHGNLRVNGSSSGSGSIGSTMFVNKGKWYVEMIAEDMGNGMSVGIKSDTEGTSWKPTLGESVIYQSDSNKIIDGGSATSYGATYGVGDIIGIKINLDDGEIEFLKNNSSQGNASTSLSSGVYFGIFFLDTSSIDNARAMFNFGQDSTFVGTTSAGNNSDANGYGDFKYAVPSGYYALNTKNLAEFG